MKIYDEPHLVLIYNLPYADLLHLIQVIFEHVALYNLPNTKTEISK